MDAEPGTPKGDRLDVLSTLAAAWEEKHHAIEAPDPVEAILFMMDQRGLSRRDMEPYIGSRARVSEVLILSIRIRDIDLGRRIIHIPKAKSVSREQPITKHLVEFLRGYIEAASPGQEWLFSSIGSCTGHTINIEKPFRRVVQAAGLNPKVIVRHTLRHTAITHLVQAGVDLPTVKRISGHKTLAMVERYSHQNGAHIQAAMDKLEKQYQMNQ